MVFIHVLFINLVAKLKIKDMVIQITNNVTGQYATSNNINSLTQDLTISDVRDRKDLDLAIKILNLLSDSMS